VQYPVATTAQSYIIGNARGGFFTNNKTSFTILSLKADERKGLLFFDRSFFSRPTKNLGERLSDTVTCTRYPYSTVLCTGDIYSGFLLLCTIYSTIPGHVYRIAHMATPAPRCSCCYAQRKSRGPEGHCDGNFLVLLLRNACFRLPHCRK
jgi:hypothetical protein